VTEVYTPGYADSAIQFMARRTAQTHASFLLPYLKSGMRMLDCGCGPGTITAGLASTVYPAEIVAMDMETSQLDLAKSHLEQQAIQNVSFSIGTAYAVPFPDESFDAVFAHAVFEHLKDPLRACQELKRVLKPGGLLALRSPDWGGFIYAPVTAALTDSIEYFKKLQMANGGDVFVGRKLKRYLLESGFSNVTPTAEYEIYDPLEPLCEFLAHRVDISLGAGLADATEIRRMSDALRQLPNEETGLFFISWCEVVGQKPG
jgi:ubiquinone/menaquinone biosynthesis C-methylase UbiE